MKLCLKLKPANRGILTCSRRGVDIPSEQNEVSIETCESLKAAPIEIVVSSLNEQDIVTRHSSL